MPNPDASMAGQPSDPDPVPQPAAPDVTSEPLHVTPERLHVTSEPLHVTPERLHVTGSKIIRFDQLTHCGKEVWIEYEGQLYRLRTTRHGKLVLSK
jgi:hemin uptake protein HemP